MLGVARVSGAELVTIQQLKGIEHRGPELALDTARDPAQGVLGSLFAVVPGDRGREYRVIRALVLEAGREAGGSGCIHGIFHAASIA